LHCSPSWVLPISIKEKKRARACSPGQIGLTKLAKRPAAGPSSNNRPGQCRNFGKKKKGEGREQEKERRTTRDGRTALGPLSRTVARKRDCPTKGDRRGKKDRVHVSSHNKTKPRREMIPHSKAAVPVGVNEDRKSRGGAQEGEERSETGAENGPKTETKERYSCRGPGRPRKMT